MRQRALVHVAGPAGAGKTSFVEALLRGVDGPVICVRAERDDSLRAPRESAPRTAGELRRYLAAGASAVARYRFPAAAHADPDAFFMTDLMADYSAAVIIEGDCPLAYVDLTVFVASPPLAGSSLLVRVQRERAAEWAAALDTWERVLADPAALVRFLTQGLGEPLLVAALADPAIVAQHRATMSTELQKLRAAPPPAPTEHWSLAPGYQGLERAQLVVVSAHDDDRYQRGHALVQEVVRLRKDAEVFKDVFDWRGSKTPVTAVVARLAEPRDLGLKKAVARVRRAIRSVQ
jgi:hypothetical protein